MLLSRIWSWLLMASGRLSKSKVFALLLAAVNLSQSFGWTTFSADQLSAINALLAAGFGLSLRDGISKGD